MRRIVLFMALALVGCAGPRELQTASMLPEATFRGKDLASVRIKLSAACEMFGGRPDQMPGPDVTCVKTMDNDDWRAAMWNVETGTTAAPLHYLEFSAEQIGPDVRVVARQYGKTRSPFGVSKLFEMDRAVDLARAQKLLNGLAS